MMARMEDHWLLVHEHGPKKGIGPLAPTIEAYEYGNSKLLMTTA
jgi:hypothetical protein